MALEDSAFNKNEYQLHHMGCRRPVRMADKLTAFVYRLSRNLRA
jgi:hypothetical protein